MVALNNQMFLKFSKHATMRCQQRGLRDEAVDFALNYGEEYYAGKGAKAYFLGKRSVSEAWRKYGINLDRWRDIAVIIADDTVIVTVQHVSRPKRSWHGRH